ncbi:hypothetical protein IWQ61_005421 [Dispira simplex]|nr:hypothetical protein IWQ61_005421 [Dispira simplex]
MSNPDRCQTINNADPSTPTSTTRRPPKLITAHSSTTTLGEVAGGPSLCTTTVHARGQPLGSTQPLPEYGKLHVHVLRLLVNVPVKRPYLVLTLGEQIFQSSVSNQTTGEWNEGFAFFVTYHTQLFGTCQIDVWDSVTILPDRHIGRTEIKLALLNGLPPDFTSYYEIWDRKLSSSAVSDVKKREMLSTNVGAIQVRICYQYQRLEDPPSRYERQNLVRVAGSNPLSQVNSEGRALPRDERPTEILPTGSIQPTRSPSGKTLTNDNIIQGTSSAGTTVDPETDPQDQALHRRFDHRVRELTHENSSTPGSPEVEEESWEKLLTTVLDDSSTIDSPRDTVEPDRSARTNLLGRTVSRPVESLSSQPSLFSYLNSVGSYVLSKDTLKVLQSVLRLLYAFNQGVEMAPTELLSGLLILERYHRIDALFRTTPQPNGLITDLQTLELQGRYCKYAMATYGWKGLYFFGKGGRGILVDSMASQSDLHCVKTYLGILEEDLLLHQFNPLALFQPGYFIAYDRFTDAIVLSIRGTMSTQDTLVDLVCEYQKWKGGLVHSGIKAAANWLMVEVVPKALAHAQRLGIKRLVIAGHSLGGSSAALLTMMLLEHALSTGSAEITDPDASIPMGPDLSLQLHCYAYGPAPCVSPNLVQRYQDYISCFVYRDDVVCRLSYGSMVGFKAMVTAAAELADALPQELLRARWQFPEDLVPWVTTCVDTLGNPSGIFDGNTSPKVDQTSTPTLSTSTTSTTLTPQQSHTKLVQTVEATGRTLSDTERKWLLRMRHLHEAREKLMEQDDEISKLVLPGKVYQFHPDTEWKKSPPERTRSLSWQSTDSPILAMLSCTDGEASLEPTTLSLPMRDTPASGLSLPVDQASTPSTSSSSSLATSVVNFALSNSATTDISHMVTSPLERALLAQTKYHVPRLHDPPHPRTHSKTLDHLSNSPEKPNSTLISQSTTTSGATVNTTMSTGGGGKLWGWFGFAAQHPPTSAPILSPTEVNPSSTFENSSTSQSTSQRKDTKSNSTPKAYPQSSGITLLESIARSSLAEVLVRPNMFPDHMPNVYEEAFAKAREALMRGWV